MEGIDKAKRWMRSPSEGVLKNEKMKMPRTEPLVRNLRG